MGLCRIQGGSLCAGKFKLVEYWILCIRQGIKVCNAIDLDWMEQEKLLFWGWV
jgi:hypothetical protein